MLETKAGARHKNGLEEARLGIETSEVPSGRLKALSPPGLNSAKKMCSVKLPLH